MALSFTAIPDNHGPAVYLFGDGSSQSEKNLQSLGEEIDRNTPESTQVVILDKARGDGLKIKEFYALMHFPCALIVMDDDTIARQWELNIPKVEEITYALGQINGHMRG